MSEVPPEASARHEAAADAILLAVLEAHDGDLRAAFAVLCARVTLEEVAGETFAQALGRAVAAVFARPALAYRGTIEAPPRAAQGDP